MSTHRTSRELICNVLLALERRLDEEYAELQALPDVTQNDMLVMRLLLSCAALMEAARSTLESGRATDSAESISNSKSVEKSGLETQSDSKLSSKTTSRSSPFEI